AEDEGELPRPDDLVDEGGRSREEEENVQERKRGTRGGLGMSVGGSVGVGREPRGHGYWLIAKTCTRLLSRSAATRRPWPSRQSCDGARRSAGFQPGPDWRPSTVPSGPRARIDPPS